MSLDHMIRRRPQWCAAWALVLFLTTGLAGANAQGPEGYSPAPGPDGQALPIDGSGSAVAAPQPTPDNIFGPGNGYGQPPVSEDIGVGGMGVLSRFGHIAGQNIERTTSLTYLDLSPYMFVEDTYLFTDLRGFYTNEDEIGGSTGVGARHFFRRLNAIIGGSFWYDMDASRNGVQFDQVGASIELFTEWLDVRANWYSPQGITRRDISTQFRVGSEHFVGNNLAFNTETLTASSMEGVDMMFTIPVVGKLPQELNMELSAGWYHYQARNTQLDRVWGWKARLDGDLFEKVVHSFLELSNDNVFDTNVVFGIDLNYWNGLESRPRLGTSQFNRIAQWTRRNRNVVTTNQLTLNPDQLAINPNTGNPYVFAHVRNVPPPSPLPNPVFGAGDGSITNPYKYILEAFNGTPAADVYYVHADSVYDPTTPGLPPGEVAQIDDTLVIPDGKIVFGEYAGQQHNLPVVGFPNGVFVPRVTSGTNRPIFQNVSTQSGGPIVQMGNGTTFSGFQINNALIGDGIGIDTVGGVTARDNIIDGTNGNGITVTNAFGIVNLDRTTIANTQGNGLEVQGGNALVQLQDGSITHSAVGSFAVLIQNNFGAVNLLDTEISEVDGLGVLIQNSASTNSFGDITIDSTDVLAGLRILNSSGDVGIGGNVSIANVGGPAVEINGYTGDFSLFGNLDITGRNDIGIQLLSMDGTATFLGTTTISAVGGTASGDPAINFQSSAGAVAFNDNISIIGSPLGNGIRIGGGVANSAGASFAVAGTTSISGAGDSAIEIVDDAADVTFNGVAITGRQDIGIEISNTTGRIQFLGTTRDTAPAAPAISALSILDAVGPVTFGSYEAQGVVSSETDPAVNIQRNGGVSFGSLSVTGVGSDLVFIADNNSISINGGRLLNSAASTAAGDVSTVHVENAALENGSITFDSIASDGAIEEAIRVVNLSGGFAVRGTGTTAQNTISDTVLTAAEFVNVGAVNLTNQIYTTNVGRVIELDTVGEFTLTNSILRDNGGIGVAALDVFEVTLSGNIIENNRGVNQIFIDAQTLGTYTVEMINNTITDTAAQTGGGDMVRIQDSGAGGSILELNIQNNGVPNTRTGGFSSRRGFGAAALGVDWDGQIAGDSIIANNVFNLIGSGHTGVSIVQRDSSAVSGIQYSGNVLQTVANSSSFTGLFMEFAGQVDALISNNFGADTNGNPVVTGFLMQSIGSTAMDLSFNAGGSNVTVSGNFIDFTNPAVIGTGIQFSSVNGGGGTTTVGIGGNQIIMSSLIGLPNEIGITFNSIVNGPVVLDSLNGQNNIILDTNGTTNFVTPFFIPGGSSVGQIIVNGFAVP